MSILTDILTNQTYTELNKTVAEKVTAMFLSSTTMKIATSTEFPPTNSATSSVTNHVASSLATSSLPTSSSTSSILLQKILDSLNTTTTTVASDVVSKIQQIFTQSPQLLPEDVGGGSGRGGGGGGGGGGDINVTSFRVPGDHFLDKVKDEPPLLGSSSDLSDLGWIIPVVIVCIVAMVGLAFGFYYGVRKLEFRLLGWCYKNCACCCKPGEGEEGRLLSGERRANLQERDKAGGGAAERRRESVKLRDFRDPGGSWGSGSRNSAREYTPRKHFNPFDD